MSNTTKPEVKCISRILIHGSASARHRDLFIQAGFELVDDLANAQIVVIFGGDGTILKGMAAYLGENVPILGVNAGHIGFLADCELAGLSDSIDCLLSGDYQIDTFPALKTTDPRGICVRALNEICISRAAEGGILHIRVLVDGREVAVVASDGILVATPSGSTAYNLSCGGPILHPNLPVVIITPICPHLLSIRPIVVSLSSKIEFTILRSRGKNPLILADGIAKCGSIKEGDTIAVQSSSQTCPVVRTGRRSDYYALLGKKLGWGYRG